MSVYYRWLCDERKEYFDPGDMLGPKCPFGGYGIKAGSIPYSAWVVGALATECWLGCRIRLVGNVGDEYECNGYEDVSQHVLRELLHRASDEALEFLVHEVWRATGKDYLVEPSDGRALGGEKRYKYVEILKEWAREDWLARCADEACLNFGERHQGDHRPALPLAELEYQLRQYMVWLGTGEAAPGEEISLSAEITSDFEMEKLIAGGDALCFAILRISVAGTEVSIAPGLPTFMIAAGGLPVRCSVKTGKKIKVVFRNDSDQQSKIAAGVIGVVREKNPKWSPPESGEKVD